MFRIDRFAFAVVLAVLAWNIITALEQSIDIYFIEKFGGDTSNIKELDTHRFDIVYCSDCYIVH